MLTALVLILLLSLGTSWWDDEWHYRVGFNVTAEQVMREVPVELTINLGSLVDKDLDMNSVRIVRAIRANDYPLDPMFSWSDESIHIYFVLERIPVETQQYYVYFDVTDFPEKEAITFNNTELGVDYRDMNGDGVEDILLYNSKVDVVLSGRSGAPLQLTDKYQRGIGNFTYVAEDESCFTIDQSKVVRKDYSTIVDNHKATATFTSTIDDVNLVKGRDLEFYWEAEIEENTTVVWLTFTITNLFQLEESYTGCEDCEYSRLLLNSSLPFFNIKSHGQTETTFEYDHSWDGPRMVFGDVGYFYTLLLTDPGVIHGACHDPRALTMKEFELGTDATFTLPMVATHTTSYGHIDEILNRLNSSVTIETGSLEYINYCGDGKCNPEECFEMCEDCSSGDFNSTCVGDSFCAWQVYGENCETSADDCSCTDVEYCKPDNKLSNEFGCVRKSMKIDEGMTCVSNEDCQTGNCVNGICCQEGKDCCLTHEHCGSDRYCLFDLLYCTSKKENGVVCNASLECSSGNCKNVCCQAGSLCCRDDEDCLYGMCTDNNFCIIYLPEIVVDKTLTSKNITIDKETDITVIVKNVGRGLAHKIIATDPLPENTELVRGLNQVEIEYLLPEREHAYSYTVRGIISEGNATVGNATAGNATTINETSGGGPAVTRTTWLYEVNKTIVEVFDQEEDKTTVVVTPGEVRIVVATPTPVPTMVPTPEPTPESTPEPTPTPTPTPTPVPTPVHPELTPRPTVTETPPPEEDIQYDDWEVVDKAQGGLGQEHLKSLMTYTVGRTIKSFSNIGHVKKAPEGDVFSSISFTYSCNYDNKVVYLELIDDSGKTLWGNNVPGRSSGTEEITDLNTTSVTFRLIAIKGGRTPKKEKAWYATVQDVKVTTGGAKSTPSSFLPTTSEDSTVAEKVRAYGPYIVIIALIGAIVIKRDEIKGRIEEMKTRMAKKKEEEAKAAETGPEEEATLEPEPTLTESDDLLGGEGALLEGEGDILADEGALPGATPAPADEATAVTAPAGDDLLGGEDDLFGGEDDLLGGEGDDIFGGEDDLLGGEDDDIFGGEVEEAPLEEEQPPDLTGILGNVMASASTEIMADDIGSKDISLGFEHRDRVAKIQEHAESLDLFIESKKKFADGKRLQSLEALQARIKTISSEGANSLSSVQQGSMERADLEGVLTNVEQELKKVVDFFGIDL